MSLADELLADLEDDKNDDDDLDDLIKEETDATGYDNNGTINSGAGESSLFNKISIDGIEDGDDDDDEDDEPMEVDVRVSSIRELCKLRDSKKLQHILTEIDKYIANPRKSNEMIGNVESDPEYQLIVEANSVAVDVDNEISIIHKFTKNKYQKRFPELDSLIVGEMEYLHAVKELGNDLDEAKNNEKLQQILTQATIMIVSVTASTTQG